MNKAQKLSELGISRTYSSYLYPRQITACNPIPSGIINGRCARKHLRFFNKQWLCQESFIKRPLLIENVPF